eukprot:4198667-Prymnesium_polylepis.2
MATLERLRAISGECDIPLVDIAIAWPLHNPAVTCVIAGATKAAQVDKNVAAAGLKLSPELLDKLNAATDELKQAMGTNCDLWQGLHADGKFDGRVK